MKHLSDFTNKYQISKTLRFKLIPIGKTEEFIKRGQFIENDERRENEYKKIKGFIDEYHKLFIAEILSSLKLPLCQIESLYDWYANRGSDPERKKNIKDIQAALRKTIANAFTKDKRYEKMFKKEMITEILPNFLTDEQDKSIVNNFKKFVSYFVNFHNNRKNIYSGEEKSTAISHRIVNQNLMKFFDNHTIFSSKVKSTLPDSIIMAIESDFNDILCGKSIKQLFSLDNFTHTLCQADIERYNAVIGGRTVESKNKEIKGINQYINEHNQICDKGDRIPLLKPLFNQILSDREKVSFVIEDFKKAPEAIHAIFDAYNSVISAQISKISTLLKSLNDYNLDGIFIKVGKDSSLVSARHFGSHSLIADTIAENWEKEHPRGKTKPATYQKNKDKYLKTVTSISLGAINSFEKGAPIENYFMALGETDKPERQEISIPDKIKIAFSEFEKAFPEPDKCTTEYLQANVATIKSLLDLIKEYQWFVALLLGNGDESEKDENFYGEFTPSFEQFEQVITPLYNKVRNFLTKKPYSTEKFKINFENVTLLKGWDENKEKDNASIILRKDGLYYLGVFNNNSANILNNIWPCEGECYEKMVYKFFKDATTMIPKCSTQLNKVKEHFAKSCADFTLFDSKTFTSPITITKEIFDLNNITYDGKKKFQKEYLEKTGDQKGFSNALSTWKHFCLQFLKAYKSTANYDFSEIERNIDSYSDLPLFYQELNNFLYKVTFERVSADFIHQLVNEGCLYLFQIYSKDFSPYSKGKPNLHTIYWRMLFDEENLSNVVYKLNGEAEIFFRPSSIKCTGPTHLANQPIENKSEYNKKNKPSSTFGYDLFKDRRYTKDQFEFHAPITLNFKQPKPSMFNDEVRTFLKENGVRHIIGIDRGERNLLYLVMVDLDGNIKKQISLNNIASNPNNTEFKQDFHAILHNREGDRQEARRNWSTIQNIKELKEGYMSLVVHEIVKLMLKEDAIVVLENLNRSFMQIRGGIEKSVYQKFEKMLIDKLGYIVDKDKAPTENGGALHAIQLADTFENYNKYQSGIVRQCGFIFYVPAWCTSKIDPTTGFVPMLKCKYDNIESSQTFFSKFDSIRYNEAEEYFEFKTNYANFYTSSKGGKQQWNICSFGERILTQRAKDGHFESKTIALAPAFKELFAQAGINIQGNIKAQIVKQNDASFFKELHHLLRLTLQMRNSNSTTGDDYIISPVKNKDGEFFDSRRSGEKLPQDADANGAYNIARKGLMLMQQLNDTKANSKFKPDISNEKWLEFAQK